VVPPVGDPAVTTEPSEVDLVGEEEVPDDCKIAKRTLRTGDTGASVLCLQKALIRENRLVGDATGTFDGPTRTAIIALQTEKSLFVDGEVGRESALALGIWPEEKLNVVRTPPPAPGAKDSMGFPLSSVASTGADAPALPANSGEGRRLVYDRAGQRVWAVDKDGSIIRSWLVSGSQYNNELPGTHKVYSKSEVTTAWNGKAFLKLMVRWLKTEIGAIGFHQIPVKRSDGSVYQTEEELGTRLSGGCQRQAKEDAEFLWKFAKIGTPVVVI
jgi:lipoprotein-anchoring transpeptidase ErfK/SrfK